MEEKEIRCAGTDRKVNHFGHRKHARRCQFDLKWLHILKMLAQLLPSFACGAWERAGRENGNVTPDSTTRLKLLPERIHKPGQRLGQVRYQRERINRSRSPCWFFHRVS
jgi:hypothetical protein